MKKTFQKFSLSRAAEKSGLYIVGVLAAIISLFISVNSLLHTTACKKIDEEQYTIVYNIKQQAESIIYYNDNFILNLIILALSLGICFIVIGKLKKFKLRYKVLFIFLWTFILGTIWVISSQTAPTEDSETVTAASVNFAVNDFSVLEKERYFKNYSFQLGYVLFNEIIIRIANLFTKPQTLIYLEVLNAFFLAVINVFIVMINDRIFKNHRVTTATAFILALSISPIISCSFLYGIFPGMMFAVIGLYCEIRWLKDSKYIFSILSILSIAMAVFLKSNYMIWLVAMVLIALVTLFKRKRYIFDSVFIVLAVAVSLSVQPAVKKLYEYRSGVNLGDALPYVSWIAMGMNESDIAPGWYNSFYTLWYFEMNNYDVDATSERSSKEISDRVEYFLKNPQYADDFFYLKTASQWNETSYQSIWNNVVRFQYKDKNAFASWVCCDGEDIVRKYMDYVAQLAFFGFCAGCFFMIRRKNFIYAVMPLVFLGGFLFHFISEGKSQYITPYFIIMCGFSAFGVVCIYEKFSERIAGKNLLSKIFIEKKKETVAETEAVAEPVPENEVENETENEKENVKEVLKENKA